MFTIKAASQTFNWVENRLLSTGLKYEYHSFSSLQIKLEKIVSWKICVISSEKVKDRGGKVNRTSVYAEAAVRGIL